MEVAKHEQVLDIAIGRDPLGNIMLAFGEPIQQLSMTTQQARELGLLLLEASTRPRMDESLQAH